MNGRSKSGKLQRITLILAVLILAPCLFGFWVRRSVFIATAQHDSLGAFAILQIFNYLLATCGFIAMMAWAVLNGMFKDVERPKFEMLEREKMLDRQDDDAADWWKDDDAGPDSPPPDWNGVAADRED